MYLCFIYYLFLSSIYYLSLSSSCLSIFQSVIYSDELLKGKSTDLQMGSTLEFDWVLFILEMGNRFSVVNWPDVGLKASICTVILSIYTKPFRYLPVFSPGRCIVFWSTGCCSGHDSVFSVVILCSVQRPNAGRKSACCGRCLLLPVLSLTHMCLALLTSLTDMWSTDCACQE